MVVLLGVPERIKQYPRVERDAQGRWPLVFARQVAEVLQARLEPACERIEIAGSIRRQKPTVGDVELLCIPRVERVVNLLGEPLVELNHLDELLAWLLTCDYQAGTALVSGGLLHKRPNINGSFAYGPKNKLLVHAPTGLGVDIFTADVRNWGMSLMIRTGSAQFCARFMARLKALGKHGHAYGGITLADGTELECPTEEVVFRELAWPWMPPTERRA